MVLWIHASSTMCSNVFMIHYDTFASARYNRHTEAGKFDVQTRLSFCYHFTLTLTTLVSIQPIRHVVLKSHTHQCFNSKVSAHIYHIDDLILHNFSQRVISEV